MSAWKEQLHDELDGLTRDEQIRVLVDSGWSPGDAIALLDRQHIQAKEVPDVVR